MLIVLRISLAGSTLELSFLFFGNISSSLFSRTTEELDNDLRLNGYLLAIKIIKLKLETRTSYENFVDVKYSVLFRDLNDLS